VVDGGGDGGAEGVRPGIAAASAPDLIPASYWPHLTERFSLLPWMVRVPPTLGGLTYDQVTAYVERLEELQVAGVVFIGDPDAL